ncbi:hypothetical protein GW17_00012017, partial [Ensete ventricosum]
MACKGFWECLLKLLNVILTLAGLAMVGYGVYLLVEWNKIASGSDGDDAASPTSSDSEFLKLGRPMLVAVSLSSSFLDYLPKAWYGILHFFCFPSPKEFFQTNNVLLLKVHLFVYWYWGCSICHIMVWLHWSSYKERVLPVLRNLAIVLHFVTFVVVLILLFVPFASGSMVLIPLSSHTTHQTQADTNKPLFLRQKKGATAPFSECFLH